MCASASVSLGVEKTKPSAEYLKYLGYTEKYGDHSEGVHGTEEDGFLKVFRHHALSHIKGLFQSTGITHVQRVDLGGEKETLVVQFLNVSLIYINGTVQISCVTFSALLLLLL